MHPKQKKDQFLYLRSQNWSLNRIAKEIGVCRTTLVEWNREFEPALRVIRSIDLDEIHEQILTARRQDLARLVKRQFAIEKELASRSLKDLPTEKLIRFASAIREEVNDARIETRDLADHEPYISDGLTFLQRLVRANNRAIARRQASPPAETAPAPKTEPAPAETS